MNTLPQEGARRPGFDRAFVESWFGRAVAKRGSQYLRDGRVEVVDRSPDRIVANVAGSAPLPYLVRLDWSQSGSQRYLATRCSCPVGVSCKHAAAVALRWLAPAESLPALAPFDPARAAPAAFDPSPSPWASWLRPIAKVSLEIDPFPVRAGDVVVYLFDVESAALWIRPVRCRPLASGRLGDAKPYRLESIADLERIRKLPSQERALLLALDAKAQRYEGSKIWFRFDESDTALLAQILATGRAHWQQPSGQRLQFGPPRAVDLEWRMRESGDQYLHAGPRDGSGTLCGDAWNLYVDTARHAIGPTDAGELQGELARLARMPALRPEHLEEARSAITAAGIAAQLPAPRPIEVVRRRAQRVTASVTLGRPPYDHEATRLRSGVVAVLTVRYDGQALAANDHGSALRQRRGDRIELLAREPEFERVVAQVLGREGFRVDHRYDYGYGHPEDAAQARWIRPQPLQGLAAIEAWVRAFSARVSPYAIVVETSDDFPVFAGLELAVPDLEIGDEPQTGSDWFEAKLGIDVDGVRIDLLPILLRALADPAAVHARGLKLTLPDGRSALVPTQRVAALLALLAELEQRGDAMGVPRARLAAFMPSSDWRFLPGPRIQAFLAELENFGGLAAIATPPAFNAALRAYQSTGLAWLDFLRRFRFGGVLADDMGLGKTVQVLAHLVCEQAAGRLTAPALVICPTSVAPNWLCEAARFAPTLRTLQLMRGDRSAALASVGSHDLVITSYALMLRDAAVLGEIDYSVVVFDEAQWLKNRASRGYRAGAALKASRKICLTGTPVENHLGELKAQLDLVMPGLLGDEKSFARRFRTPIEREGSSDAAAALRQRLRPFLLRRTKQEVAQDLPPRTLIAQPIELDGAQRDLYESLRVQMEKRVREALMERGLARSRITVLDALLKLRQVCCDPRLVDLPSARKVEASAKREALMDLLPTLIEDGRSILLFSQFTSMLDLIGQDLDRSGQRYLRLDGSTVDRRAPVEAFQRGDAPLFLISLKAGGVGLNLTRADTVILYDPWWNPATEAQAIDRAHRIGQDKPVFVYELNCVGTVEEKMQKLKARKRALADAVLESGDAALGQLDAAELMALFAPD